MALCAYRLTSVCAVSRIDADRDSVAVGLMILVKDGCVTVNLRERSKLHIIRQIDGSLCYGFLRSDLRCYGCVLSLCCRARISGDSRCRRISDGGVCHCGGHIRQGRIIPEGFLSCDGFVCYCFYAAFCGSRSFIFCCCRRAFA